MSSTASPPLPPPPPPPETRWRTVERPDVALQVRVAGAGAPWLLLHGFPDDGGLWQPLQAALQARSPGAAQPWMPDLRGHGRSLPAGGGPLRCDIDTLLADVDALVEAAGGGAPVVLVGHDWGGMLAWCYAARHPGRLRALAVFNAPHPVRFAECLRDEPTQRAASGYAARLASPEALALLAADGHARLRAVLAADGAAPEPEEAERLVAVWARALPTMLAWYAALDLEAALAPPGAPAVPAIDAGGRIAVPTLLLWGERDRSFVPAVLDGLEALVPRLSLRRFADGGHWLPRSHAPAAAAALLDFVAAT